MWKLAWKHYIANAAANTLLMAQLILMYMAAIAVTSTVISRFQDYLSVRDMIEQEGDYYFFRTSFYETEKLKSELKGDCQFLGCYRPGLGLMQNGIYDDQGIVAISYDDAWIDAYTPALHAGTWLNADIDHQNCIPVVISSNEYGISLEDHLTFRDGEDEYDAVVIGVLEDDARILTAFLPDHFKQFGANQMYQDYNPHMEEKMLVLMPERILAEKRGTSSLLNGQLLIQYPNGFSERERKENDSTLKKCGMIAYSCDTNTLKGNSLSYIYESCKILIPIVVSVLILVMTSVISMSALFAKRQLRNDSIYYICGARWNQCIRIHLYAAVLTMIGAFSVTILGLLCFRSLLVHTVLSLGTWQILSCAVLSIIHLIVGMIMPIQILRGQTPKEILNSG